MSIRLNQAGYPILDQFSEEGFIDCTFRIIDLVESEEFYNFRLLASHLDELVGFDVAVVKNIKAGFDSEMELDKEHVYRKGVSFIRSGEESDRLISGLADLYGMNKGALKMVPTETFTAIALHQGDIDMSKEPIKIKLFGRDSEPYGEDDYFESFFNLDISNGFVYWNEKDSDYRNPLIQGLSE